MTHDIDATYSPEDNKLRLYPATRLDSETFQRVKDAGYKWAPKQGLFVAPKWTPAREDLALELAGEIEAEQMTLAERAQIKAERLEGYADNRLKDASAYQRRASELSEHFYMGQPILVGHHSERRARKAKDQMHRADENAHKAHKLAGYWLYRASGVEYHANRKNDPKVRARRIKTLLAELRDLQRTLNEAHKALAIWDRVTNPKQIVTVLGMHHSAFTLWQKVSAGEITPEEARNRSIAGLKQTINSPNLHRWIEHTLNRLAYERELLGQVPRYAGEIKATTIQMFLREHGADKPKATQGDGDSWIVECDAPLPLHIGDGKTLELSADEWRDLMQSCGYVPPEKKPAKPPILNFESPTGFVQVVNPWRGEAESLPVVDLTKAEYGALGSDYRGTRLSTCGNFRVRIAPNPKHTGPRYSAGWAIIHLTDQKDHPTPESADFAAPEVAA